MPKATKEERESSEELVRFRLVLDSCGIVTEDPEHPLSERPPSALSDAVASITGMADQTGFKKFAETYMRLSGKGVTSRAIGGWLSDSRKVPALRVAQVADLAARYAVDAKSPSVAKMIVPELYESGFQDDHDLCEAAFSILVESLFRVSPDDLDLFNRLIVLDAALNAGYDTISALVSVIRIADRRTPRPLDIQEAAEDMQSIIRRIKRSDMLERAERWAESLSDAAMESRTDVGGIPFL